MCFESLLNPEPYLKIWCSKITKMCCSNLERSHLEMFLFLDRRVETQIYRLLGGPNITAFGNLP